mmetsp:Transcript_23623/g.51830  ORF Transcript_23623/g.51830 Transcript_23623/m.51830 type:complete len:223 (-) Transcript_23623:434-1102(-)
MCATSSRGGAQLIPQMTPPCREEAHLCPGLRGRAGALGLWTHGCWGQPTTSPCEPSAPRCMWTPITCAGTAARASSCRRRRARPRPAGAGGPVAPTTWTPMRAGAAVPPPRTARAPYARMGAWYFRPGSPGMGAMRAVWVMDMCGNMPTRAGAARPRGRGPCLTPASPAAWRSLKMLSSSCCCEAGPPASTRCCKKLPRGCQEAAKKLPRSCFQSALPPRLV